MVRPATGHRVLSFRTLAWVIAALAVLALLTGVVPLADAIAVARRTWPVIVFLLLIKLVSDILDDAGVFTLIAALIARFSRGRTWLLFTLYCLMCILATAVLSLDATVVLMTPIAIGLSRRLDLPTVPMLFATVWIANVASLVLPVSNLTNLIAQSAMGWSAGDFARAALPVQLALLIALGSFLVIVFRRDLAGHYVKLGRRGVSRADARPIAVILVSLLAVIAFASAVVAGVQPWLATAVLVVVTLGIRAASGSRIALGPDGTMRTTRRSAGELYRAMPWDMAVFALGLFVIVEPISHELAMRLAPILEASESSAVIAGLGALGANLINNLPAYLALEASAASDSELLALLVGVNAGPLITPWASLANLLWMRLASERGVRINIAQFVGWGLVLVPVLLLSGVGALTLVTRV